MCHLSHYQFFDIMILKLRGFYLSSEMVNNKTHIVLN